MQNTQISESKEFRRSYTYNCKSKDEFREATISVSCYRGELVTPRWKDVDIRKSLISWWWNINATENLENYSTLCTLEVDLSRLPVTCERKVSGEGMYYRVDYDIVLLFGVTELQAMLAWTENVGLFFDLLYPFCLQNVVGRVLNDGVQRRSYMIPTMILNARCSVLPLFTSGIAKVWNFLILDCPFAFLLASMNSKLFSPVNENKCPKNFGSSNRILIIIVPCCKDVNCKTCLYNSWL